MSPILPCRAAAVSTRHDPDLGVYRDEPPQAVTRPAPPPLIYQHPLCRLCREEVEHDGDGWHCPRCSAYWPSGPGDEDSPGQWDDEDEPQCTSVGRPRNGDESTEQRCMLGETHIDTEDETRAQHSVDGMTWGDNYWVVEVRPALTVEERDARNAEAVTR